MVGEGKAGAGECFYGGGSDGGEISSTLREHGVSVSSVSARAF